MQWVVLQAGEVKSLALRTVTEVANVPGGCLVKTTTCVRTWYGGRTLAVSTVFVPHGQLNAKGVLEHRA